MVNLLYTVSTALGAKVAILEDAIIQPPYRSQGIGRQLLSYAFETARENGCKRITLLTDGENHKGQSFYSKLGFKPSSMVAMRLFL
jgi:GNAT superfamily N-acetyltransferase